MCKPTFICCCNSSGLATKFFLVHFFHVLQCKANLLVQNGFHMRVNQLQHSRKVALTDRVQADRFPKKPVVQHKTTSSQHSSNFQGSASCVRLDPGTNPVELNSVRLNERPKQINWQRSLPPRPNTSTEIGIKDPVQLSILHELLHIIISVPNR